MKTDTEPAKINAISVKKSSKAPVTEKIEAPPQAKLAPGFGGGGFMLMSRMGDVPKFSRKATAVAEAEAEAAKINKVPTKKDTIPPKAVSKKVTKQPDPPKAAPPPPPPAAPPAAPAAATPAATPAAPTPAASTPAAAAPASEPKKATKQSISKVSKIQRFDESRVERFHDRKRCLLQCDSMFADIISSAEENWLAVVLLITCILTTLTYLAYEKAMSAKIYESQLLANGALFITILSGIFGVYILNLSCWGLRHDSLKTSVDDNGSNDSSNPEDIDVEMRRLEKSSSKARHIFYTEASLSSGSNSFEDLEDALASKKDYSQEKAKSCTKIGFRLKLIATLMIIFGGIGLYICGYEAMEHSHLSSQDTHKLLATSNSPIMIVGWILVVVSTYFLWPREPTKPERVTKLT